MMRALLLAAVLNFVGGAAYAEQPMLLATIICDVKVEYEASERMLHVRHSQYGKIGCRFKEDSLKEALEANIAAHPDLALISLGRMEDYPWIASSIRELAAQDDRPNGRWDGGSGKARHESNNAYIASLLAATAGGESVLGPIKQVLEDHGYVLTGVSVEKVIAAPVSWPADNPRRRRLPTDALVHLRIAKEVN